jgi:hypothetical protein
VTPLNGRKAAQGVFLQTVRQAADQELAVRTRGWWPTVCLRPAAAELLDAQGLERRYLLDQRVR